MERKQSQKKSKIDEILQSKRVLSKSTPNSIKNINEDAGSAQPIPIIDESNRTPSLELADVYTSKNMEVQSSIPSSLIRNIGRQAYQGLSLSTDQSSLHNDNKNYNVLSLNSPDSADSANSSVSSKTTEDYVLKSKQSQRMEDALNNHSNATSPTFIHPSFHYSHSHHQSLPSSLNQMKQSILEAYIFYKLWFFFIISANFLLLFSKW